MKYTKEYLKKHPTYETKDLINHGGCVHKGLHAYTKKFRTSEEYHMVKMIIPKGSQYFLGSNYEIVTNNLIWY